MCLGCFRFLADIVSSCFSDWVFLFYRRLRDLLLSTIRCLMFRPFSRGMVCFYTCCWGLINKWYSFQLFILRQFTNRLPDVIQYQRVAANDEEIGSKIRWSNGDERKLQDENAQLKFQNEELTQQLRSMDAQHAQTVKSKDEALTRVREACQKQVLMENRARELEERIRQAIVDKDDALERLSKLMSLNLRDNNPDIADLNDENRPTKLAEMSSELYDNEWTDAFDDLMKTFKDEDGDTEKLIIRFLLDVLMETYLFCKRRNDGEWKAILNLVWGSNQTPSKEELKTLKDLRKKSAVSWLEKVQEECVEELSRRFPNEHERFKTTPMLSYIHGCSKLAWMMQFQDPVVVFGYTNWRSQVSRNLVKSTPIGESDSSYQAANLPPQEMVIMNEHGDKIPAGQVRSSKVVLDKGIYREYTTCGHFIDFIVWPEMRLYEGGPLLSKGVAQGCNTPFV